MEMSLPHLSSVLLPLAHSDVVDYYLTCSRRMNSPFQQVSSTSSSSYSSSSFAVACFRNISQCNYSVLSTSTDSLKVSGQTGGRTCSMPAKDKTHAQLLLLSVLSSKVMHTLCVGGEKKERQEKRNRHAQHTNGLFDDVKIKREKV